MGCCRSGETYSRHDDHYGHHHPANPHDRTRQNLNDHQYGHQRHPYAQPTGAQSIPMSAVPDSISGGLTNHHNYQFGGSSSSSSSSQDRHCGGQGAGGGGGSQNQYSLQNHQNQMMILDKGQQIQVNVNDHDDYNLNNEYFNQVPIGNSCSIRDLCSPDAAGLGGLGLSGSGYKGGHNTNMSGGPGSLGGHGPGLGGPNSYSANQIKSTVSKALLLGKSHNYGQAFALLEELPDCKEVSTAREVLQICESAHVENPGSRLI